MKLILILFELFTIIICLTSLFFFVLSGWTSYTDKKLDALFFLGSGVVFVLTLWVLSYLGTTPYDIFEPIFTGFIGISAWVTCLLLYGTIFTKDKNILGTLLAASLTIILYFIMTYIGYIPT